MRVQFKSSAQEFYDVYLAPIVETISVLPIDKRRLNDHVFALQSPHLEMPVDPNDLTQELHNKFRDRCGQLVHLMTWLPNPDVMPGAVLESIESFRKFVGAEAQQEQATSPQPLPALETIISPTAPIAVNVEVLTVTIVASQKSFQLGGPELAAWLKILADRPGQWVSSSDLESIDSSLMGKRSSRLVGQLPKKIAPFVEVLKGKGARVKVV